MVINGTHLDERGHPWSSMALTRADGTPSALVLDFVLALAMPCPVSSNVPDANVFDFVLALELALELDFELALELKLDGRSATCE